MPTPQTLTLNADPGLAKRLSCQINNKATERGLPYAPKPGDPYSQPAGPEGTNSIREARWTRDAPTHTWSRHVIEKILEHRLTRSHNETARPARGTHYLSYAGAKPMALIAASHG